MFNKNGTPHQRKPRKGLLERQERILRAAETVFAQKGFKAATVDEIAALAGVGKGTVYRRCGDKQQLFHALLHAAADSLAKRIVSETEREADPVKKFKKVFEALCEWYEKHLDLGKLFFSSVHSGKKKRKQKKHNREDHPIFQITMNIIEEGIKEGNFSGETNPSVITEALFHFLTPFLYEELGQRFSMKSAEIAETAFLLFYKGIRA